MSEQPRKTLTEMASDEDDTVIIIMIIIVVIGMVVAFVIYFKYFAHPPSYDELKDEHCEGLKGVYKELGLDPNEACKKTKPHCGKGRDPKEDGTCDDGYVSKTVGDLNCCLINPELTDKDKKRLHEESMKHLKEDVVGISVVVSLHLIGKKALKHYGKKALTKMMVKKGKTTALKGLVKMGEKTAVKAGAMMADEGLEMGACLAIPPPIGELAAAAEFLGFIGDVLDVGGYHQYMDNKKDILKMRDQMEGRLIDYFTSFPGFPKPPFCFKLSNLSYVSDYHNDTERAAAKKRVSDVGEEPSDKKSSEWDKWNQKNNAALVLNNSKKVIHNKELKDIYDLYTEASSAHQLHAMMRLIDAMPPEDAGEFFGDVLQGKDLPEKYTKLMDGFANKEPLVRDQEIWAYMKGAAYTDGSRGKGKPPIDLGISQTDGKLVMFRREISSKTKSGITLNPAGVKLYNSELDKIPVDKDTGPRPYLVYSKFYRDAYKAPEDVKNADGNTGKKYFVKQNALPTEFATISYSYAAIHTLCTTGLDKKSLEQRYPIQKLIDLPEWSYPSKKVPKDHDVDYDPDTGLCKYHTDSRHWEYTGWCAFMEFEEDPKYETMACEQSNGGCDPKGARYPVCHKNDFNKWLEWIFPQTIIGGVAREIGKFEDFIDHNPVGHFFAHTLWHPSEWF